ncbi:MAG TPA: protoporphyrinogen oxidase [Terriglobia bacterium]|nr:protoporphyrinogen oxidase [Terriglobia bacterium]
MDYTLSIRRVAVLGGGISGLTTAYALARARESGAPIDEFLIEGSQRLGGVIETEHLDGFVVEKGPDSFISQKPEAAALCRELGLGDSLMGSNDAGRQTYILHNGKLTPLPDGLMMMLPTHVWPLLNSPLLPFGSKLNILAEWFFTPPKSKAADESVASFVRRHFGKAMLENIVEPLLAGVYGGDSAQLSVASVLPRFVEMERVYGSLVRAGLLGYKSMKRIPKGSKSPAKPQIRSLFVTLKGGLGDLIKALEQRLDPARVQLNRRILAIERADSNWRGPYRISCEGGVTYDVDAVVLALPAHECAKLLPSLHEGLAKSFEAIPYSSAVTVTLGFDPGVAELPPGFGFLVPKKEDRQLLACTFVHRKFRDRVPEGKAMLRCFLGGARDPEVLQRSDEEILKSVWRELCSILVLRDDPLFWRISRWPSAMAQYTVGHQDRVDRIMSQLAGFPRLFPAGNAYSGIGLSDCIRTARNAVKQVLEM